MFDSSSIIVGLEIGTSKVCAVVGELNPNNSLNIIGLGQSKSRGARKGEISNATTAAEDIRNAIVEAEQMADVEIRSVFLGVSGAHVTGFNNRGVHTVVSADREITEDDLDDVIKNAKAVNVSADNYIIHAVRQHFLVDGQEDVASPVGMVGSRLEVDMHIIHGKFNRLQNPVRAVKGLQLEVDAIVYNGLASSLAVLSREQKEMGSLVIDIGGGTTDYVIYHGGIIRHTGVISVGGDHVSNDLAFGLKVPLGRAEELKIKHGSALWDESENKETIASHQQRGFPSRGINLGHLRRIMSLRLEETFQLIAEDIANAGLLNHLTGGIVLCGGVSRTPKLAALAERIFRVPISVGRTHSISGLKSALDQPEFSTGIGLVKFGTFQQRKRSGGKLFGSGFRVPFAHLFKRR